MKNSKIWLEFKGKKNHKAGEWIDSQISFFFQFQEESIDLSEITDYNNFIKFAYSIVHWAKNKKI